jgi:hypothetical protein
MYGMTVKVCVARFDHTDKAFRNFFCLGLNTGNDGEYPIGEKKKYHGYSDHYDTVQDAVAAYYQCDDKEKTD